MESHRFALWIIMDREIMESHSTVRFTLLYALLLTVLLLRFTYYCVVLRFTMCTVCYYC